MVRRLLLVLVALIAGCTNKGVMPPLVPGHANAEVYGTGRADLWRVWSETPPNAGQGTPLAARLQHHDGNSLVSVTVPAIFTEAACGVPTVKASLTPGKLWLASQYAPQCGLSGAGSFLRIVLGTVARDGTWVDRSTDLPAVTSPAAYLSVDFTQGAGLLLLRVRARDAQGREGHRWFRVTDQATTELTIASGTIDLALIVDGTHVYGGGGSGLALTHRLEGDQFVALSTPLEAPAGFVSRGGPEVWVWNANDVLHQDQNRSAFRFDGTSFQKVAFSVEDPQAPGYTWQAVAAVPRGNGKLTLLGYYVGSGIYAYSEHDFTARQLSGEKLTGNDRVFGTLTCDGSNQSGLECTRVQGRHEKTLDDGTIILRGASRAETGAEATMVLPTDIP